MRLGQASFLEDDDDIEVISEHAGDSLDFLSENLTTEMDRRSPLYDGDKQNATERNRNFHETMDRCSAIIVQPKGRDLERSCRLEQPVFFLRDLPVKEQYKKALKKIHMVTNPELVQMHSKPEKSIANMMLSSKGSLLDVQKQIT